MRCEVCFQGLDAIVSRDCSPAGYRDVLEALAERDASDALYMRSRITTASVHQSRTNWQLYLAEYEMLHGSRDEAQRLASDASLDPLTPRMQHLRDGTLRGLDAC